MNSLNKEFLGDNQIEINSEKEKYVSNELSFVTNNLASNEILKNEILNLGDIDIEYKKFYIAFKGNTNIADAEIYNSKIKPRLLYIDKKTTTQFTQK